MFCLLCLFCLFFWMEGGGKWGSRVYDCSTNLVVGVLSCFGDVGFQGFAGFG